MREISKVLTSRAHNSLNHLDGLKQTVQVDGLQKGSLQEKQPMRAANTMQSMSPVFWREQMCQKTEENVSQHELLIK